MSLEGELHNITQRFENAEYKIEKLDRDRKDLWTMITSILDRLKELEQPRKISLKELNK